MESGPFTLAILRPAVNTTRKRTYYTGGSLVPHLQQLKGDGLDIEWLVLEVNDTGRRAAITVPGESTCSSKAPGYPNPRVCHLLGWVT